MGQWFGELQVFVDQQVYWYVFDFEYVVVVVWVDIEVVVFVEYCVVGQFVFVIGVQDLVIVQYVGCVVDYCIGGLWLVNYGGDVLGGCSDVFQCLLVVVQEMWLQQQVFWWIVVDGQFWEYYQFGVVFVVCFVDYCDDGIGVLCDGIYWEVELGQGNVK